MTRINCVLLRGSEVLNTFHIYTQAEACKSIEHAMKKCPNGMYSEIKYDGERVQVHKNGDHFSYFSRSLKPVLPHKVSSGKFDIWNRFWLLLSFKFYTFAQYF